MGEMLSNLVGIVKSDNGIGANYNIMLCNLLCDTYWKVQPG